MTASHLQACFVIHRRDYSNTSLLLELFTLEHGRLPAIARGAKSGRGAKALLLRPFQPLLAGISGRGEVLTLGQVEPEGRAFDLDGPRLYCGFYLNELLMRLLGRNDPHPDLFASYLETLSGLSGTDAVDGWLRHFEVNMLKELGYALLLTHEEDTGEPVEPDACYRYEIEQGPVRVLRHDGRDPLLVAGRTLLALQHRSEMDVQSRREARDLMRSILAFYLGDKPLKSRELFQPLGE